jgi:RNA polymerase primary sigma factor
MIAPATTRRVRSNPELRRRTVALRERSIEFIANDKFAAAPVDELLASVAAASSGVAPVAPLPKRATLEIGAPLVKACETPLLTPAQERLLFEQMNHLKFNAARLREWLPERPDEKSVATIEQLLEAAEQVRNRIVAANVRLVISIVKTFADWKQPLDELTSEGVVSLMHAVEKFDFDRGFRFSTYATRAIRRTVYKAVMQRQKERTRFGQPTTDMTREPAAESQYSPFSEKRWDELQHHLKRLLQQLDARERQILKARFGMEKSGQVQTLQALARTLGVCKERVRQLEQRAIDKLQKFAREIRLEEPAA